LHEDVGIIKAADEATFTLVCGIIFIQKHTKLIGGINTNYNCDFNDLKDTIFGVVSLGSLLMENGILDFVNSGESSSNCHLGFVSDDGMFILSHVEIKFSSKMGNLVEMNGGTLIFENVKMLNIGANWITSIVSGISSSSFVAISFISCVCINRIFELDADFGSMIYIGGNYGNTLNISFSSFLNFTLNSHNGGVGIVDYYPGYTYTNVNCGMLIFFFCVLMLL
jgi:hypothetical protein